MTNKTKVNIRLIFILLFGACAFLPIHSYSMDENRTTIFLVRHAEPDYTRLCEPRNPHNPCLSDVGKARAEQLVQVLKKANIEAIYSTSLNRTQETARPLSETLKLRILPYSTAQELARKVRSHHKGQRILVVSHSGTTGPTVYSIINALNGEGRECKIINEFDNICLAIIEVSRKTEVVNLQYGKASNGHSDLIIESLKHRPANPRVTQQITVTAVVKNVGKERASPSTLSFRVGGETSPKMFGVPALMPGKAHSVSRQTSFARAGRYRITAVADVENSELESNEGNNTRTADFRVIAACLHGEYRYLRCNLGGRWGFRRDRCVHGTWRKGPCIPGRIP